MLKKSCVAIALTLWAGGVFAADAPDALPPLPPLPPLPALPERAPDAPLLTGTVPSAARYRRLGELARENGDHEQAAQFFHQALDAASEKSVRNELALLFLNELILARTASPAAISAEITRLETDGTLRAGGGALALLKTRLMLAGADASDAEKQLAELRRQLRPGDAGYGDLLELEAAAAARQGDLNLAATRLSELEAAAVTDAEAARVRGMLTLNALLGGDIVGAKAWLHKLNRTPGISAATRATAVKLELLIAIAEGRFGAAATGYRELANANHTRQDALLCRLAAALAEHEGKQKNFTAAAALWREAFVLADDEAARRSTLHGLIDTETAAGQYAFAVRTIERYLKYFPQAKDLYELRLHAATLLANLQKDADAAVLYREVFNAPASMAERLVAARELARLAQQAGNYPEAEAMFRFVAANADSPEARERARQLLGEYLYSQNHYPEAARVFGELAEKGSTPELREIGLFWLLQSRYQLREYPGVLAEIGKLATAKSPELQRRGAYLHALTLERLERTDAAVAAYLDFVKRYPAAPETAAAHFAAGDLALKTPQYPAVKILTEYAALHPGENAANALYKALSELFVQGKEEAAVPLLADLEKSYPESKYTIGALFWQFDFLRTAGRNQEALKLLTRMESRYAAAQPELVAEIAYDRAMIYGQLKDEEKARAELQTILAKYADKAVASKAFFMLGDIESRHGRFEEAAALYRQAGERQPGGSFAAACAGRAADAAFAMYAATKQERWLKQATAGYEALLRQPELAEAIRDQTLYKLGRCLEATNESERALGLYRELIYNAVAAKRANRYFSPVWSAKASHAAVNLCLAGKNYSGAEKAVEILTLASELDLPDENEAEKIRSIREEYDL